jgi:hypothetical protein
VRYRRSPNEPIDEAKAAGKTTADFPQIAIGIFRPMDGRIDLSPEEIMGRNTWNHLMNTPRSGFKKNSDRFRTPPRHNASAISEEAATERV